MKVKDLMQSNVATSNPQSTLSDAARLMKENDCGVIPIEDPNTHKLCGVITDRDMCMAAYSKDAPLTQLKIKDAMHSVTETCRPDDDISVVHEEMRNAQVRRVPVTDNDGKVVGIVSLNDLAVSAATGEGQSLEEVATTLAGVCRHTHGSAQA